MDLYIQFTARPSPDALVRAVVIFIVIITMVVIRVGYWPGTVLPAVLSVGLAAVQACRTLLAAPGSAELPAPGAGPAGSQ